MCPLPSSARPQRGALLLCALPPPDPPVPDREAIVGEFVELLATETLPVALPEAVGANVTMSVAVWLGASVVPALTPLALNSLPVTLTLEMMTFELPLFVRATFEVLLCPTAVFPKLYEAGEIAKPVNTAVEAFLLTAPGHLERLMTASITAAMDRIAISPRRDVCLSAALAFWGRTR
jgi:hypothetical protein